MRTTIYGCSESLDIEQVCFNYQRAEVAQSVEQGTENPRVGGSILSSALSFGAHVAFSWSYNC